MITLMKRFIVPLVLLSLCFTSYYTKAQDYNKPFINNRWNISVSSAYTIKSPALKNAIHNSPIEPHAASLDLFNKKVLTPQIELLYGLNDWLEYGIFAGVQVYKKEYTTLTYGMNGKIHLLTPLKPSFSFIDIYLSTRLGLSNSIYDTHNKTIVQTEGLCSIGGGFAVNFSSKFGIFYELNTDNIYGKMGRMGVNVHFNGKGRDSHHLFPLFANQRYLNHSIITRLSYDSRNLGYDEQPEQHSEQYYTKDLNIEVHYGVTNWLSGGLFFDHRSKWTEVSYPEKLMINNYKSYTSGVSAALHPIGFFASDFQWLDPYIMVKTGYSTTNYYDKSRKNMFFYEAGLGITCNIIPYLGMFYELNIDNHIENPRPSNKINSRLGFQIRIGNIIKQ